MKQRKRKKQIKSQTPQERAKNSSADNREKEMLASANQNSLSTDREGRRNSSSMRRDISL